MKTKQLFRRNKLVLSVASAMALGFTGLASSETESFELDIKSQKIGPALVKLGELAGVQIMVSQEIGDSLQLSGLKGSYTLSEALDRILGNTGLAYEFRSDELVIVNESGAGDEAESADESVEEIVVTGTLLRNVSPTSPVVSFTRDDFDRQGVTTAADILRLLPQNLSSNNASSSLSGAIDFDQLNSATPDFQGTSSVNLRGLGSGATLVLINGRRVAGSPVGIGNSNGSFANLATIPSAAIERIDVLLDGASAIYGADAVGGVINVILQKNYSGATTTVRYEDGANGGDSIKLSQNFGVTWGRGSMSLNLQYDTTDEVSATDAGFTSLDFRPLGGTDRRQLGSPQSANIDGFGSLPVESDGVTLNGNPVTPGDYSDGNVLPGDVFSPSLGPNDKTKAAVFALEQEVGETVKLFADVQYSTNRTRATRAVPTISNLTVPGSNPFNMFGTDVKVGRYNFSTEQELGLLRAPVSVSDNRQLGANVGFEWDLPYRDFQLVTTASYSELSDHFVRDDFIDDDGALQAEALATLNLFGNGKGQPVGADLNRFYFDDVRGSNSFSESLTFKLEGGLLELPGGELRTALQGEYRQEEVDYKGTLNPKFQTLSTETPSREINSLALDVSIPLVGENNNLPLVKALSLQISARWDDYNYDGVPVLEAPGTFRSASFSNTSPRIGFRWDLSDTLVMRGAWSESFRAPEFNDILNPATEVEDIFLSTLVHINDPQFNCIPFVTCPIVRTFFGGNPNVQPELSDNITLGFDWTSEYLDGLTASVTYTNIEFTDKIATLNPFTDGGAAYTPNTVVRDEMGNVVEFFLQPVNLSSSVSKSIDFNIGYAFDTDFGAFEARFIGVYTSELQDVVAAGQDPIIRDGTNTGPSRWSTVASLSWFTDGYGADLFVRRTSGYSHIRQGLDPDTADALPPFAVEHYTTIDLTGHYQYSDSLRILGGARNLFNNKFPFVNGYSTPFDFSRVDPKGRVIYLEVQKTFDL